MGWKGLSQLVFLFALSVQLCVATHFRYGAYRWTRKSGLTLEFTTVQARRWTYPLYPKRQIGQTIDLTSGSTDRAWNWGYSINGKSQRSDMIITVDSFDKVEDWVLGKQVISHTFPSERVYTIQFSSCCRISTLREGNNDQWYYLDFNVDTRFSSGAPTKSPAPFLLPVVFFTIKKTTSFQIPYIASDSGQAVQFQVSTSYASGLIKTIPTGLTMSSSGVITWNPQNNGLYAFQVTMKDQSNTLVLDFLLNVAATCSGSNCNNPPFFEPATPPTYDIYIGVEIVFDVKVRDNDANDSPTLINGDIPAGAVVVPTDGCLEGTGLATCTRRFRWTPSLGQGDTFACFTAHDQNGGSTQGLYCIQLRIGAAKIIFLSGILRDFHYSSVQAPGIHVPDFDRATGASESNFVSSQLGSDAKPVYTGGAGTSSTTGATNFNRWWNTDPNKLYNSERVHSITLSNAGQADDRIFSFSSLDFFPIDDQLFGNEGRDHNYFFTYEVHTYIDITQAGGEVFQFQSADDFWLFIDGKLAVDLHGLHATPATATLNLDTFVATHGLTRGNNYRVDFFYAHRGSSTNPSIKVQLNEATLCNALSSGLGAVSFTRAAGFDGTASTKLRLLGQAADASAGIQGTALRLVRAGLTGSSAVWFATPTADGPDVTSIKFLNGFRCSFSFRISSVSGGTAEGFAFVLQSDSTGARGAGGSKLGYDGITKSIAIEFDGTVQADLGDPSRQHVSIHSKFLEQNSALEQFSLGVSDARPNPLQFQNGTVHNVVIEYTPAPDDSSGGPLLGWIRVFMGTNSDGSVQVVPYAQAQVDGAVLKTMFPGAGYVGFTSSNSDSHQANVDINYWTMEIVPPSASETNAVNPPAPITAGTSGSFKIQSRDACAQLIRVGGEGAALLATVSPDFNVGFNDGPPLPGFTISATDNGDGTYSFPYSPQISSTNEVVVTFGGTPIKGSPFTLQVNPAATSPTVSRFRYGEIPREAYSNFPTSVSSGFWVVQIDPQTGAKVDEQAFASTSGGISSLQTHINGIQGPRIVAVVVKGSAWSSGNSGIYSAIQSLGSSQISSVTSTDSWALIGAKPSTLSVSGFSVQEQRKSNGHTDLLKVTVTGSGGTFVVEAQSAATAQGNQGYIQAYPTVKTVTAASNASFTITARDSFNNINPQGGDAFTVQFIPPLSDGNGLLRPLQHTRGVYTASWFTTLAGQYQMYVRLNQQELPGSPMLVNVIGGDADPARTTASGSGIITAISGTNGTFRVKLRDRFDNEITTDKTDVAAIVDTPSGVIPSSNLGWDATANAYVISYVATTAGTYSITLRVNSVLAPVVYRPQITPGSVSPAHCTIEGLTTASAGVRSTFTLVERDANSNEVVAGTTPTVSFSRTLVGTPQIQPLGAGRYEISFVARTALDHTVTVRVGGTIIGPTQTPVQFSVVAGPVGDLSELTSLPSSGTVPSSSFSIISKDSYGNLRTGGGDAGAFFVEVRSPGGGFVGTVDPISASSTSTYTVSWNTNTAASYNITVIRINGTSIAKSPATIQMNPTFTQAANCQLSGGGVFGGVDGEAVSFFIEPRDQYDNAQLASVADSFAVDIIPFGGSSSSAVVTSSPADGLGRYIVNYTVPAFSANANNFTIRVRLLSGAGAGIVSETVASIIQSGAVSYANATGAGLTAATAGQQAEFQIIDKDANGNELSVGGKQFVVTITGTGLPSIFATVEAGVYPQPARYRVRYTPQKSGTYEVHVKLRGVVEIEQTAKYPQPLVVSAGAVSPALSSVSGFPQQVVAGGQGTFTVAFRDLFGNRITRSDLSVLFVPGASDIRFSTGVFNAQDNTYTVTFFPFVAGSRRVQVQESGQAIGTGTARYELTVVPKSTPNAPNCTFTVFDTTLTAGATGAVLVTVRDEYGNIITAGVSTSLLDVVVRTGSGANATAVYNPIASQGGGTYLASFIPQAPTGTLYVHVTVGGLPVQGSPSAITLNPGAISAAQTTIEGPSSVEASQPIKFTIVGRDQFGNPFRDSPTAVTVGVGTTGASVQSVGGGRYNVTYSNTRSVGAYAFVIVVDGTTLPAPPSPTIQVTAGGAYADFTIVPSVDPTPVEAVRTITIETRDQFGNRVLTDTASLVVTFVTGEPGCDDDDLATSLATSFTTPVVQYVGDGKYNVSFSGTATGTFTLNMTVNGRPIPCASTRSVIITAGAVVGANSQVTGEFSGSAGALLTLAVTLRDKFNNIVRTGGNVIKVGEAYGSVTPNDGWLRFPKARVNVTDGGNGAYSITYTPFTVGSYLLVVTVNSELIPVAQNVTVIAGPVASFVKESGEPFTAAQENSITVRGTDAYGNRVDVDTNSYTAQFVHAKPPPKDYGFSGKSVFIGNGVHRITFTPYYSGPYTYTITMTQTVLGQEISVSRFFSVTIQSATCGGVNPNTPYRCPPPNNTCVSSYALCPNSNKCPTLSDIRCADGSCRSSAADCPCPSGQIRCASGQCASLTQCLEPGECPSDFPVNCSSRGSMVCRKTLADCPSPRACPPGWVLCNDGLSCAPTSAQCFPAPSGTCPSPVQRRCATGECVESLLDCPSGITCAVQGHVVCPDGSCKPDATQCPPQYECPTGTVRCQNGVCRKRIEDCPALTVCPPGWTLCEIGSCVLTSSACPSASACSASQTRCPDGSCTDNLLLCATPVTCPSDLPVLCSGGECVASVTDCSVPGGCPNSTVTCPDGACVAQSSQCPTRTSCPSDAPVQCPDGECRQFSENCTKVPACPRNAPVRCADGSCRGALIDCPTRKFCPASSPTRCLDGSCVAAVDLCSSSTAMQCPIGLLRCPGGECAASPVLCPTPPTCALGFARCQDGTCRITCPEFTGCDSPQVKCPQSSHGVACAATVEQCPQGFTCPTERPVRCLDRSCAATVGDCPPPIDITKTPCPDGSFESNRDDCGTSVTCPASAAYKCWDDTCRKHPLDCPDPPKAGDRYRCPDGSSQARPTDCRAVSAQCPNSKPVRCPDGNCYESKNDCPSPFPAEFECPHQGTRCVDGACVARASLCPAPSCPPSTPVLCDDGQCALTTANCPNITTACPADAPNRCWSGKCVKTVDVASCGVEQNCTDANSIRCPDGSCQPEAFCPTANGCPRGQIRCHDKRCVVASRFFNPCTSGSSGANSCPGHLPFRCPGGFCALSVSLCPPPLTTTAPTGVCPEEKPVLCADGSCVLSEPQCAVVIPCDSDTPVRCDDGTCRVTEDECAAANTCPSGHVRCPDGLCALEDPQCRKLSCSTWTDVCFNVSSGCTNKKQKCPSSGACVSNFPADCNEDWLRNPPPTNGCPADSPVKCSADGACKPTRGDCVDPSTLCPKVTPFRCKNGTCVAATRLCTSSPSCPSNYFRCGNGDCVSTLSQCKTRNGCPMNAPLRCADGSCKRFSSLSLKESPLDSCPIVTTCEVGQVRCADGSCADTTDLCPSFEYPCGGGAPYLCDDGTCAAQRSFCPKLVICPSTNPLTCSSGDCKSDVSECPLESVVCDLPGVIFPFRCFDGTCASSPLECLRRAAILLQGSLPSAFDTSNMDDLCGASRVLCPDGSCARAKFLCPSVPACPLNAPVRCEDGSCATDNGLCPASPGTCATGTRRCEDGSCRTTCMPYNGCPLTVPYMCAGRACAPDGQACASLVGGATGGASAGRRLLQVKSLGSPCVANCKRDDKASLIQYTVNKDRTQSVNVAFNSSFFVGLRLVIPSGSFRLTAQHQTDNTSVLIRPVPESFLRTVTNPITSSRASEFSNPALSFVESVLSPAFECVVNSDIVQPFPVSLSVVSSIDVEMFSGSPVYDDICLAHAVLVPGSTTTYRWECVESDPFKRENMTIHSANEPATVVNSTLNTCADGQYYAFVYIPLRKIIPEEPSSTNWFQENWWVIFPILLGLAGLVALIWIGYARLYAYRDQYKKKSAEVADTQEKVDDMEQFGVQEQDPDNLMIQNPLNQQLKAARTGIVGINQNDPTETTEQYEADRFARQQEINNLETDNAVLQQELQRMKSELEFRQRSNTNDLTAATVPFQANVDLPGFESTYSSERTLPDTGMPPPLPSNPPPGSSGGGFGFAARPKKKNIN